MITWNLCFVWISEQTANFALQNIKRLVFITEVESVYSAVRTESLYNTDAFRLSRVKDLTVASSTVTQSSKEMPTFPRGAFSLPTGSRVSKTLRML